MVRSDSIQRQSVSSVSDKAELTEESSLQFGYVIDSGVIPGFPGSVGPGTNCQFKRQVTGVQVVYTRVC